MGGLVELPSGTVDQNESLTDALFREVKEEISLNITNVESSLGSFDYVFWFWGKDSSVFF